MGEILTDLKRRTTAQKTFDIIFLAVIFTLFYAFLHRMRISVGGIDEVFNVSIANQIAQGARPFVDCWDLYQTGDMFLAPFLALFKAITGSTDGILLFSRFVYMFMVLVAAFLQCLFLKKYMGIKEAILAGMFVVTFPELSLYYPWYDSMGTLFLIAGLFLISIGITATDVRKKRAAFICAGISHACMSIAYPYMVLTALLMFVITVIYAVFIDKSPRMPLFYAIGGGIIVVVALVYVLAVGYENIFLFNKKTLPTVNKRRISPIQNGQKEHILIKDLRCIKKEYMASFKLQLIPLALYAVNRIFKSKPLSFITYVLMLICAYKTTSIMKTYSNMSYIFILGLWAPLLFWDLPKRFRGTALKHMMFYVPASLCGYCMVSMTLQNQDIKGVFMFLPMAFLSVVFMESALSGAERGESLFKKIRAKIALRGAGEKQTPDEKRDPECKQFIEKHKKEIGRIAACAIASAAIAFSIQVYYDHVYPIESGPYEEYNQKVTEGIYKGLSVRPSEAENIRKYEEALHSAITDDDKTILVLNSYRIEGYLISDLKPASHALWSVYTGGKTDALKLYFEKVSGEPDIIVTSGSDKDFKGDMKEFVTQKYYEASKNSYVIVYRRKDTYR